MKMFKKLAKMAFIAAVTLSSTTVLTSCQRGIEAAIDWRLASHVGAFAELNWGLTGIHHSDFKTIEQTLYPIFATIGINYKLK